MLFTSPVYSQASGSIAGITYSHNRGGMYTRARVTPTDPSTTFQQQMRAAVGTLAPYWGQSLTQTQRGAWDLYASNIPWINPLGETIFLTGQQHFMRCNTVRLQLPTTILDVAPVIYDLGTFTAPTISNLTDAPSFDLNFTNTDAWANGVGGFMVPYNGKSVGVGRNFYRGPWRRVGKVIGDPTPPTSPANFTANFPWGVGNKVWVKVRVIQVDGRMSLPVTLGPSLVT